MMEQRTFDTERNKQPQRLPLSCCPVTIAVVAVVMFGTAAEDTVNSKLPIAVAASDMDLADVVAAAADRGYSDDAPL